MSQVINATVFINSVDQTANLTGTVEIDIEEGKARTAFFTLLPGAGISDLMSWIGASVTINTIVNNNSVLVFTGIIDTPDFDNQTGLTKFTCTDNLQEHFEIKDNATIAGITGGYWSEAVFNESTGWEYAQERLSTIPSALDMDATKTVRVTPWAAKTTADFTFTDADIVDKTLKVSKITNRRNVINAVNATLDYRYKRLKERQQAYNWDDPYDVCNQNSNPYYYPLKTGVMDAIKNTGWEIVGSVILSDLPASGLYPPCNVAFLTNPDMCDGATFTLGKRYSQNITEKYTIRIESQDSIAALGEIAVSQNASLQIDYDQSAWEKSLIADGYADFGTPSTDINNDNYINKDDTAERQNAIDTVINLSKTKILASHRRNEVTFNLPLNQSVDVIHTAQVNATGLDCKGKIKRTVHTIDLNNASGITSVTLAISKKIGTGTPGVETPPTTPDALPAAPDTQPVDLNLLSHIGGQSQVAFDSTWSGWITNYQVITEPGYVYNRGFVVHTPAITLNSIDNTEATDTSLINVTIPDDLLQ